MRVLYVILAVCFVSACAGPTVSSGKVEVPIVEIPQPSKASTKMKPGKKRGDLESRQRVMPTRLVAQNEVGSEGGGQKIMLLFSPQAFVSLAENDPFLRARTCFSFMGLEVSGNGKPLRMEIIVHNPCQVEAWKAAIQGHEKRIMSTRRRLLPDGTGAFQLDNTGTTGAGWLRLKDDFLIQCLPAPLANLPVEVGEACTPFQRLVSQP